MTGGEHYADLVAERPDVHSSIDELLADATEVSRIDSVGRSGAVLELVSIGGMQGRVECLAPDELSWWRQRAFDAAELL